MPTRHRLLAAALCTLAAVVLPLAAQAGTVTWNFYGHLTENSDVPSAPLGTSLFLSVSHPLNTVDDNLLPEIVGYSSLGGTAGFGTTFATTTAPHPTDIYPYYHLQTILGFQIDPAEAQDGYALEWVGITLSNEVGPAPFMADLPLALNADDFEVREFYVRLLDLPNAAGGEVTGFIDRIEVVINDIPAPGIAALFGFGALFLGLSARRTSCV